MKPHVIDILVADKVMGFEVTRDGEIRKDGKRFGIPSYSQKIEHAWMVVEKFDHSFKLVHEGGVWLCRVLSGYDEKMVGKYTWAEADTAPLAICLAALRSAGVEVEVDE